MAQRHESWRGVLPAQSQAHRQEQQNFPQMFVYLETHLRKLHHCYRKLDRLENEAFAYLFVSRPLCTAESIPHVAMKVGLRLRAMAEFHLAPDPSRFFSTVRSVRFRFLSLDIRLLQFQHFHCKAVRSGKSATS
jgi:hypothetical protein